MSAYVFKEIDDGDNCVKLLSCQSAFVEHQSSASSCLDQTMDPSKHHPVDMLFHNHCSMRTESTDLDQLQRRLCTKFLI